jgi:pyruvate carboxylase subunit B
VAKRRVHVMCTAFRDGFQSVFGARVLTDDFLPAVEAAKAAGFNHFEAGGGARYQALYLYCREDAFDMMDRFRATVGPDVNLQTLARGVNVVGLDSQSSDVIDAHAKLFKKHGITTIRNFDALNDVNNLIYSGQCIHNAGLKHEVVVALMALPPGCEGAHTPEFYVGRLKSILDADLPFSSVCFKDASGTTTPAVVYDTIKAARALLGPDVHIQIHAHETAGISLMQYKAALDAGADGIDLSLAPVSGGTAQIDAATAWHALRGTEYDLGFDIDKTLEAEEVFKECMADYFIPPESKAVEPLIPFSPMPGGALTANTQMMRDNGMLDRYPAVIRAMGDVVRRGGFGTSVTPVSQFYFQQAFNNVIFGPWKRIAEGYGKMVLGYFGKTPVPPDAEIVALAAEQLGREPTTRDPRELNDEDETKGLAQAQRMISREGLPTTDENVFIAATCKEKGIAFLKGEGGWGVRKSTSADALASTSDAISDAFEVKVGGKSFTVHLDGEQATVNGTVYDFDVRSVTSGETAKASTTGKTPVKSEVPGRVLRVEVTRGDLVRAGQVLMVVEALKMEMQICAPVSGAVESVSVSAGDQIKAGDALVVIG